MASAPTPFLDHIVILVPHSTLLSLPSWLPDAFTVLTGGRHADGVTENRLILFSDGVYLELIAFVPGKEEQRKSHRWGQRREGHIVDWANSLPFGKEDDLEIIRKRVAAAESGIRYSDPAPGGRVKPDGTELKWVISAPYVDDHTSGELGGFVGGEAPFWCLDRTPRDLRVPYQVENNVRHPCGALGVVGVSVSVRDEGLFNRLKSTYDALQGHEGVDESSGPAKVYSWSLQVPEAPTGGGQKVQRTLSLAQVDSGDFVDVHVKLSLVSSTREGSVSGHVGDEKSLLEFDIHKA